MVHVGQFKQLDIRGVAEQGFNDGSDSKTRTEARAPPRKPIIKSERRVILKRF